MPRYNLIIAGVGGQGVVLAGNIIGEAAMMTGYDVKKTDTLGMAQRGGSVVSHLRIADKVFSPLINREEADIMLAFEKLEAARWSYFLKTGGIAIVNSQALAPLSVNLGSEQYPSDNEIRKIIEQYTKNIYIVDGTDLAEQLGEVKTLNVLMLGCLSNFMPFTSEIWRKSIVKNLPTKVIDLNLNSFKMGTEVIRDMMNRKTRNNDD
ncbi:MAG: indolepyruvate oxidoreductase subunit beta [Dehalococcoidia bacterium]|nr:MAG: indolepyruvate oxidoreductase subunit beta [Dehalococcoidia bacterium]